MIRVGGQATEGLQFVELARLLEGVSADMI